MISFLVVNWNGGEIFKKSLLSINQMMARSTHNYEIAVVDNASADLDRTWIQQNVDNIRIHENKTNEMFAKGTNQSVALARGELLMVINNDIIFHEDCVDNLLKGLNEYDCDLVVPKMLNPDGTVQRSIRGFPTLSNIFFASTGLSKLSTRFDGWLMRSFDYERAALVPQPMFSAMLLPIATWKKVGDMDENFPILFNDVDWFKRFETLGLKAYYVPEAVVTHVHGMSVNKSPVRKVYTSTLGMYRYFMKHGRKNPLYKVGALGISALTFAGRLAAEILIKPMR